MKNPIYRLLFFVLLFCFLDVCFIGRVRELGEELSLAKAKIKDSDYRRLFYSEEMRAQKKKLSPPCREFLSAAEEDSRYFPVPLSAEDPSLTVSYVDSWMGERNYKGKRGHEGTDIMASENTRGLYPVVSISDGTVTNLGWLEQGGWRVGITSPSGVYYYYAHLESYDGGMKEGARVRAGQLLGYMGDSGYGKEGTTGQFAVHLHLGIYSYGTGEEISVNPYYLLKSLEKSKLKYSYS